MSISLWPIYGYGIELKLRELNFEKISKLLREKEFEEEEIIESLDDFYNSDCMIEDIIINVTKVIESNKYVKYIGIGYDGNSEDNYYLMYHCTSAPWEISEEEKEIKEENIKDAIVEIMNKISNIKKEEIEKRFEEISTSGEG